MAVEDYLEQGLAVTGCCGQGNSARYDRVDPCSRLPQKMELIRSSISSWALVGERVITDGKSL